MRYRLTTRGRIVAVVFAILIVTGVVSLYDTPNVSDDSNIKVTVNNGVDNIEKSIEEIPDNESEDKENTINEEEDKGSAVSNLDDLTQENTVSNDSSDSVSKETVIDDESKILRETAARVYFKPDKYNLVENEIVKINKLVEIGLKYPDKIIVVEGNINGYPQYDDTEFGKNLSDKRAEVIKDFLIEKGIKKEMIHISGLGSKKPIENTSSVSDSWKNRRADIYFKGYNSLEY